MASSEPLLKIAILTIFPEIFPGPLNCSLAKIALNNNIWSFETYDIKNYGLGKHKTIDDKPYGGGSGMVMKADVLSEAIEDAKSKYDNAKIIYMSPRGKLFNQNKAKELSQEKQLIILCGRFEAIDERLIEEYNIEEVSIGDFVLFGGEIASLALIESCVRLLPGVLENQDSLIEESFGNGDYNNLLEYPQYTRPPIWKEREVPQILISGNHELIKKWRLDSAKLLTEDRRPDLLQKNLLDK